MYCQEFVVFSPPDCLWYTHISRDDMYPKGQRDKNPAEFQQPQQKFQAGLRFESLKDAIVHYLRELGSSEGSVADTRDRKEWKSSSLHSADLKAHRQIGMNLVHTNCSDYGYDDGIQGYV